MPNPLTPIESAIIAYKFIGGVDWGGVGDGYDDGDDDYDKDDDDGYGDDMMERR